MNRLFGSSTFRFLRFVWNISPGWSVASLVLVLIQGVLPLVSLYLMKLAVDSVADPAAQNPILGLMPVVFFIGLLALANLLEAISAVADRMVSLRQENTLADRMYHIVHAKSSELDLEYYENSRYYDTLHRAQHEAPLRPARVLGNLKNLIQSCISTLAVGALLVWLHWAIVIVLLAATLPGAAVRLKYAKKLHVWERQRTPTERQASYLNSMLTGDAYAKEIRLFDLASLFMERFCSVRAQIRGEKVALGTKKALAELAALCAAICVSFSLLAYLALRAIQGSMTLGDLIMFYAAVQRGQMALRQVFNSAGDLYEDNLFLSNLYEFLDLRPRLREPERPTPIYKPLSGAIVFDRVSFQYPGDDKRVLEDITLTIRPGEHIALVGENGAGKSTLVKLLCRLYDPTDGAITLDGVDLRDYSTKDLRSSVTVVFQDYARYHLSARENIWLGNIEVPPEGLPVRRAARKALIHDSISRLKNGYDTILGKWFDGGEELSAGQWQKIALARAFLRDGEIIILDEPGSALDARAEYEIFDRFHQLVKGKTAVLITHRLSTVKMVDRIYVLKQGRVVEAGSHAALMQKSGTYAWMFETQAERYRV